MKNGHFEISALPKESCHNIEAQSPRLQLDYITAQTTPRTVQDPANQSHDADDGDDGDDIEECDDGDDGNWQLQGVPEKMVHSDF